MKSLFGKLVVPRISKQVPTLTLDSVVQAVQSAQALNAVYSRVQCDGKFVTEANQVFVFPCTLNNEFDMTSFAVSTCSCLASCANSDGLVHDRTDISFCANPPFMMWTRMEGIVCTLSLKIVRCHNADVEVNFVLRDAEKSQQLCAGRNYFACAL